MEISFKEMRKAAIGTSDLTIALLSATNST